MNLVGTGTDGELYSILGERYEQTKVDVNVLAKNDDSMWIPDGGHSCSGMPMQGH